MARKRVESKDSRAVKINFGTLTESRWEEEFSDGCHEAIMMRLHHFCGIYGALSAGRRASEPPAFISLYMSLG